MSQDDHYINGELLRLGREARGWVLSDMATRACMSVKQIRQLEEGGTSAFYSPAVKMTSAKKLAGILELSPEQVFNRPVPVPLEAEPTQSSEPDTAQAVDQPVVAEDLAHEHPAPVVETSPSNVVPTIPAAVDEPKAKTSVWVILALFVAALGVAGYLQKQEEPATEPPPPLQVVPGEAEAAASAAELASSGASADQPAAPLANTSSSQAVSPVPSASAASKPL